MLETVLEILKILAWPAAAVVFGVVALFVLKGGLTRLLDRIKGFGFGSSTVDTSSEASLQKGERSKSPSATEDFMRLFDNQLLVQRENRLREVLNQLVGEDESQRDTILIRFVAAASLLQAFEYAYSAIYGSQIQALQHLNSSGQVPVEELRPFYDQAATTHEVIYGGIEFESWYSFLKVNWLVAETDDGVSISLEGREFLKYILHRGYPMQKLL